ncbi:hypothetical protein MJ575_23245 [Klebsiella pneumoniae]|nr:hypothetical protein MJ575_23245 [Klebsiella pneumoniae]
MSGAAVGFIFVAAGALGDPSFSMAVATLLSPLHLAILPCVDAGGGGGRYCAALSAPMANCSIASRRPSLTVGLMFALLFLWLLG